MSGQAIDATVGALAPALDVGRLFRGVLPGAPYALRCIICYRGHHYCALALSEELQRWLLFDDARVRPLALQVMVRVSPTLTALGRAPLSRRALCCAGAQGCRALTAFGGLAGAAAARLSPPAAAPGRARAGHRVLLRVACRSPLCVARARA